MKNLSTAVLATALIMTACTQENPLSSESKLPYGAPQFDKIKTEHYLPAIKEGIAQASAMVLQANEDAIETLKTNGVTITDIDRTALYELCKPLYEEFANDRIPTELVEMVNAAK